MKDNKTLIAVYGSLRMAHGNHRLFKRYPTEDWEYKGTETIQGFNLFSLGGFPGIEKGDNKLVIELYEVSDNVLASVRALEGYSPKSNENWFYNEIGVETSLGQARIYEYVSGAEGRKIIKDGDWTKYVKENK